MQHGVNIDISEKGIHSSTCLLNIAHSRGGERVSGAGGMRQVDKAFSLLEYIVSRDLYWLTSSPHLKNRLEPEPNYSHFSYT
jgi:hypothetical protein